MSEYHITEVSASDRYTNDGVDALLQKEGIRRDRNLDYTCAMLDEDYNVIATGSLFRNTLRCMAVDSSHQGEALMNDIVSHLIEVQYSRGYYHLFLYTKCSAAKFFGHLGFTEIARVPDQLVFMENRSSGFQSYLASLRTETKEQLTALGLEPDRYLPTLSCCEDEGTRESGPRVAALVMNANPFTRGHRYLVEKALAESDLLHLFMVSEDASLVPFDVRKKLIMEGCQDLGPIVFHESGSYIISSATFPAYFQKDGEAVIQSQAGLDIRIFQRIGEALGIQARFVGEEPTSVVTSLYNTVMARELPAAGISCRILPRLTEGDAPISASTVRSLLKAGDFDAVKSLVPESTYRFFTSPEAEAVLKRIREASEVIHY